MAILSRYSNYSELFVKRIPLVLESPDSHLFAYGHSFTPVLIIQQS